MGKKTSEINKESGWLRKSMEHNGINYKVVGVVDVLLWTGSWLLSVNTRQSNQNNKWF